MPHLSVLLIIILLLLNLERANAEDSWCYECNTNLTGGHKRNCNDPFTSPFVSAELTLCKGDQPHHCLKSIILLTVRSCVPSRIIDKYCQFQEKFPGASVECYFCKENACNSQIRTELFSSRLTLFIVALFCLTFLS
ncbi:uncharacterized protein [Prorops nasuta]|uniref:uncharacterized protein isoform X2 n=1 Tax=Prorops nasuta TaxID=863751 RepID=UPI0034CDD0A2